MFTLVNRFVVISLILCFALHVGPAFASTPTESTYNNTEGLIPNCADPFVLKHDGNYYLYCSGGLGEKGIRVYRSTDLVNWGQPVGVHNGQALRSEDVWGDRNFWAPEVYFLNKKFYMFFAVQERLAVAESDSPLGPFVQTNKQPIEPDLLKIDPHLFIDDDGTKYLYFVRFNAGNEIWVAKLNDDLCSINESTLELCLKTSQEWEKSLLKPEPGHAVNEAPFVIKHKGVYYLTYSANHTVNPAYGVGYATSRHPTGPWRKYYRNPILTRVEGKINGPGHHAFITAPSGHLYIVYHTHFDMNKMQPRKLAIDPCQFVPDPKGGPDILQVDGPSTEKRNMLP